MTLFHLHDDFASTPGASQPTINRAFAWFDTAFRAIHQAIVSARTRRLQRELMFYGDWGSESLDDIIGERPVGTNGFTKLPQRPMVLGDRWDF